MAQFCIFLLLSILFFFFDPTLGQDQHVYIIQASNANKPAVFPTHRQWYASSLASVKGLNTQELTENQELIYTYENVFHGFAALLTEAEAASLETMPGIVSSFRDTALQLHTTHTPEFLGLVPPSPTATTASSIPLSFPASSDIARASRYADDVIVGVMDTGVWPERASYNDHLLGPVPSRWKGKCESGTAFNSSLCNRKLIGARAFYKGYERANGPINETAEFKSPRDSDGHGTHTSSTAAGSHSYRASLFGYAKGTARGMAPQARIAVYKVCWQAGCFNSDILTAFDTAVADGVDIISMSLGGNALPYHLDPIALASFGAMEKGVVTSASAGNGGPGALTVGNVAPWILTVAASTLDRDFPAPIKLGDGTTLPGMSLYSGKSPKGQIPLIFAGDATKSKENVSSARLCFPESLNPKLVAGKIVLCDRGINARTAKAVAVKEAGGAAMILANSAANGEELTADSFVLPATIIGFKAGEVIKAYLQKTTKSPTAMIVFKGTALGVKPAPVMAAFSSRGPSPLSPDILKPDISAPGVNILAAWTGAIGPSGQAGDNRIVNYNILSGTSMSCPHISGLAALVKGLHPNWSPSAIKSALMTTAAVRDNTGGLLIDGASSNRSTPYVHGAGHVDPVRALDPGLLYDIGPQDYFNFLCSLNYTAKELQPFSKGQYRCPRKKFQAGDVNYPSFSLVFQQQSSPRVFYAKFRRTLINVGSKPNSVYTAHIIPPKGVRVAIKPSTLNFTRKNQRLSFRISFRAGRAPKSSNGQAFGSLVWTDGRHVVQSPIAFLWV